MEIKILPLRLSHAGGVGRLEQVCFSCPWSENAFYDIIGNPTYSFYVAADTATGTIAGYGGMYKAADEGNIVNIAVSPLYRRSGIASRLLETLIDEAVKEKLKVLMLEVRESNLPAIKLYEKYGFHTTGKRKNYYRYPTENAVLMDRNL